MSTPRQVILSPDAPQPLSVYSQAIQSGSLLFLAGQIPLDPASGELVSGSIALETERIMQNLSAVLSAAGASLKNVVKTTVYLTNMSDFGEFNEAYARHFPSAPPARTTVAVAALPKGVRIEIEAIAAL
ncbi:MAG TPA: RidA family protein [Polyangiaceae bacterium]|jgi:2-iminobutanoate/2-iminopropanoate deaminase|nr:RidA family protein [Polyangiaceae bacterium]